MRKLQRLCFVLVGIDEENQGNLQVTYKVRLPGDPIIGEGKPENQNHAIIFTQVPTCKL